MTRNYKDIRDVERLPAPARSDRREAVYPAAREVRFDERLDRDVTTLHVKREQLDRRPDEQEVLARGRQQHLLALPAGRRPMTAP